jgi:hypothetical protein
VSDQAEFKNKADPVKLAKELAILQLVYPTYTYNIWSGPDFVVLLVSDDHVGKQNSQGKESHLDDSKLIQEATVSLV